MDQKRRNINYRYEYRASRKKVSFQLKLFVYHCTVEYNPRNLSVNAVTFIRFPTDNSSDSKLR